MLEKVEAKRGKGTNHCVMDGITRYRERWLKMCC
jgi:hypothetical protein